MAAPSPKSMLGSAISAGERPDQLQRPRGMTTPTGRTSTGLYLVDVLLKAEAESGEGFSDEVGAGPLAIQRSEIEPQVRAESQHP